MFNRVYKALPGLMFVSVIAACSDKPSADTRNAASLLVIDLQAPGEHVCMPDNEFEIGGAALNASQQQVIDVVGTPGQVTDQPHGIDDWVDHRFLYDGLSVEFLQDRVVNIRATTARWRTPSGIHVGMPHDELLAFLGVVPPQETHRGEVYYETYDCSFDDPIRSLGTSFRVYIGAQDTISRMTIYSDTP